MLGKLIKHELSATAKTYAILSIICIAVTGFTCLTTVTVAAFTENNSVLSVLAAVPTYFLGIIFLSTLSLFPILHAAWRFYKNLASDEGYLMHMLPVPTWSLVFSKTLVAVIWTLLCTVLGYASYTLSITAIAFANIPDYSEIITPQSIIELIQEILATEYLPTVIFVAVMVIIIALLALIFSIVSLYLCIAIGQLWTAHRILGSILAYVALDFIVNRVVTVGVIVLVLAGVSSLAAFNVFLVCCALVIAGAVVGCYLATVNIFKKKLNLQ